MKILFVVNTTFELYYLCAVAYLLKRVNPGLHARLLIVRSALKNLSPELADLYEDIQSFEAVEITRNPIKDLVNGMIYRNQIKQLDLCADIVCICSIREYFINILCKHLTDGQRLIALRMAVKESQACTVKRPFYSFYSNFLNSLFGFSTFEYRWNPDSEHHYTRRFHTNPYHRSVEIADWGHGQNGSTYRLPPPHVALRQLYKIGDSYEQGEPVVLVAGERTPLFETWSVSDQVIYEGVFDFLRQNLDKSNLFFKPRPGFTEIKKTPVEGFNIISPDISFEELILRNRLFRVISIKSTSSKVAAYFGNSSYLLYPLFNIPPSFAEGIEDYFYDTNTVVKVSNLNQILSPIPSLKFDQEQLGRLYNQAIVE